MDTLPRYRASECIAAALGFDQIINMTPRPSKHDPKVYFYDLKIPAELRGFSDEQFEDAIRDHFQHNSSGRNQWEIERKRHRKDYEGPVFIASSTVKRSFIGLGRRKLVVTALGPIEVVRLH